VTVPNSLPTGGSTDYLCTRDDDSSDTSPTYTCEQQE
jgi:hypothetical protein